MRTSYPSLILYPFYFIRYASFRLWPKFTLGMEFKRHTGYKLNLKNPQTYNEKIQYLMLYWNDHLARVCSDKFLVRKYVEEKGLSHLLNDFYGAFDDVDDIDLNNLPDEFVMKVNHGCGQNIFCTNKNELNWEKAKKQLKKWMKRSQYYYSLEWVYKDIKPKIVVEKLIKASDGKIPKDYKVFCFNGEPRSILVASDRGQGTTKFDFFDTEWNHKNVINHYPNSEKPILKPKELEEILEYSRILSEGFPHMRVDFYLENGKVIFGECTFFHSAGNGEFEPVDYDYELGSYFDISYLMKN